MRPSFWEFCTPPGLLPSFRRQRLLGISGTACEAVRCHHWRWSTTSACVSPSIVFFLVQVLIRQLNLTLAGCPQLKKPVWSDGNTQTGSAGSNAERRSLPFPEAARLCLQVMKVDGLSASVASIIADPDCQHHNGLGFAGKKRALCKSDRGGSMKTNGPLLAGRKSSN